MYSLEEGLAGSNHLAVRPVEISAFNPQHRQSDEDLPEEDIEVRRSHLGVDRRVVDYRRNIESLTCCWSVKLKVRL